MLKRDVFCDTVPCQLVNSNRRFGRTVENLLGLTCREDEGSTMFHNGSIYLSADMVQHPRTRELSDFMIFVIQHTTLLEI